MWVWVVSGITGALSFFSLGRSSKDDVQPDPIASLTNLLIVGSVIFVGYKVFMLSRK